MERKGRSAIDYVIVILLLAIIALLLRINAKLPNGKDPVREAVDRYYREREKRERNDSEGTSP